VNMHGVGRLTAGGRAYDCVTVDVGSTNLHEQAVDRPCSAASCCAFFVAVASASSVVVPLSTTEEMIASAAAATFAALAITGAKVVVAVCVMVSVVSTRVVEIVVVVMAALVVMVLQFVSQANGLSFELHLHCRCVLNCSSSRRHTQPLVAESLNTTVGVAV
jgi:hypothetical protein